MVCEAGVVNGRSLALALLAADVIEGWRKYFQEASSLWIGAWHCKD